MHFSQSPTEAYLFQVARQMYSKLKGELKVEFKLEKCHQIRSKVVLNF
jgi:hypothetical protein